MSTERTHHRRHRPHAGPADFPDPRAAQNREHRQAGTVTMVVDLLRGNTIRCAVTGYWAAIALGGHRPTSRWRSPSPPPTRSGPSATPAGRASAARRIRYR